MLDTNGVLRSLKARACVVEEEVNVEEADSAEHDQEEEEEEEELVTVRVEKYCSDRMWRNS
jgi:hypothetical protein